MAPIFAPTLSLFDAGFQPYLMRRRPRLCRQRPVFVTVPLFDFSRNNNPDNEEKKAEDFKVNLNLKGFDSDNVTVKYDEKSREVRVKAEQRKAGFTSKYSERFTLPENVDGRRLKTVFENGVLTLTSEEGNAEERKEVPMETTEKPEQVSVEDLGEDEDDLGKEETLSQDYEFVLQEKDVVTKEPFEVRIDLEGFEEGNISVETSEDGIEIAASSEETGEDGGITEKRLVKRYKVDKQTFDTDKIASKLNDDGTFSVTIPAL